MGRARRAAAPRHVVRGRRSTREVFSSATDRNRPGREEGTQAPSAGGHRVLEVAPHGGPERLPPSTLRRTSARKAPALRGVVGGKWVIRALADNSSVTRDGRPQRTAPDTHEDAPVSAPSLRAPLRPPREDCPRRPYGGTTPCNGLHPNASRSVVSARRSSRGDCRALAE